MNGEPIEETAIQRIEVYNFSMSDELADSPLAIHDQPSKISVTSTQCSFWFLYA
ncbi:hypothetical protein KP803_13490 [Vibrio sp. ZSDE26]|uniref:Uncharacterized protein n=1 Tax=Vibrio amylolyticus TaxID=2847292 RepID=A0A9X1XM16_9VIBR|nr:hypothetical protein [Vibrio amylolyticus]MCK6264288.1 hypothetical protein [Vibrio amylolyticus]